GFARALGTRCDHCHAAGAPGADGREQLDFASDAKKEKSVARTMIRMVRTINGDYISKVDEKPQQVTCGTCHRGHVEPEPFVPPAPPGGPGSGTGGGRGAAAQPSTPPPPTPQ